MTTEVATRTEEEPPRLRYLPSLDGMRGLAMIMVVVTHCGYILHNGAYTILPGGEVGLDMFFVLSGFLITGLLLQERHTTGRTSFPRFYMRRALRLLPPLALLVVVHLIYTIQQGGRLKEELEALASIAFYFSNFMQAFHRYIPSGLTHLWSLSVEEQFYFVWPTVFVLIVLYRAKRPGIFKPLIPWVIPAGIVISVALRIIVWRTHGFPAAYELPFCRSDDFLTGAGLAYLWYHGRLHRRNAQLLGWLSVAALVVVCIFWDEASPLMYYGGFTIAGILTAFLMVPLLQGVRVITAVFSFRPLVVIGRTSYGLYLWHLFVLTAFAKETPNLAPWLHVVIGMAIAIAITWASWRWVEGPPLRLKKRYQPVARPASPEVATAPAAAT